MVTILLFYLLVGTVAGTVGGLFGVGGGVIVVPALILAFSAQGYSPEVLTHMAVATSLAAMVVTSSTSALAHYKHRNVRLDLLLWLTLGVAVGAFAGVAGSLRLRGQWIQIAFGCYLLFIASRVLFKKPPAEARPKPPKWFVSVVGAVIGGVSMVFGIGGGSLTVPFLLRYQVPSQFAVGTSAVMGVPIALMGGILYALQNPPAMTISEASLGYVSIPAFIGLALASIPAARFGAKLAQKLPEQKLKKAFGVFVLCMGCFLLIRNLV